MKEEQMRAEKHIAAKQLVHRRCTEELVRKKDRFVHVPCPACGEERSQDVFQKDGFSFVKCHACETIYVNPRPTFEMLMEYQGAALEASRIWVERIYPLSENVRREHIFKPRARRVLDLARKFGCRTKKLVDVGAGYGTFAEEIMELGVFEEVIIVESSSMCAECCRRKGLKVIEKPIEEAGLEDVDVVTNFELIEHLVDPREFILSCKRNLSKDGLLIISTPNSKGFDVATLGALSGTYQAPLHLNYFHTESISCLLESCGLTIVEILTPGLLDAELVRKKILSQEFDVSGFPFLKSVLIDHWDRVGDSFQKFLSDNKLSSHMLVAARNPD